MRMVIAVALALVTSQPRCETSTSSMYYAVPSGAYRNLTTTDQTILASGKGFVGVGTATPLTKLDVAGPMRIGAYAPAQEAKDPALKKAPDGALYLDLTGPNPTLRVKHNSQWKSMGGGSTGAVKCCRQMRVYDGGADTFIVPAGVTRIMVEAWGKGAPGGFIGFESCTGGSGAYAKAIFPVAPGEVYTVNQFGGDFGTYHVGNFVFAHRGQATSAGYAECGGVAGTSCLTINGQNGENPEAMGSSADSGGSAPNGGRGGKGTQPGETPGGGGGHHAAGGGHRVIVYW